MFDDNDPNNSNRNYNGSGNQPWRKKPISQKQFQLLHDLFCDLITTANSGQASDMIKMFMKHQNPFSPASHQYDDGTLEDYR